MTDPSGMPSLSGACKEDLHPAALLVTDTQFKNWEESSRGWGWREYDGAHWLWSLDPLSQKLLELLVSATTLHKPLISHLPGNPRYLSESYTGSTGWIICIMNCYYLAQPTLSPSHPYSLVFVPSEWLHSLAQFSIFLHQIHSGFLFHFYSLCPTCLQHLLILSYSFFISVVGLPQRFSSGAPCFSYGFL